MSIALMTLAWKSSFPSGRKMVLLALCDNANDQGDCYPSISMLADKCSMGDRTVQQHITDLVKDGVVRRVMRGGRSTIYHIDARRFGVSANSSAESAPPQILHPIRANAAPARASRATPAESAPPQNPHPTPADSAPPPPQNSHPTPADFAPITVKEPSFEPSVNQRERKEAVMRKIPLPKNWQPSPESLDWVKKDYPQWSVGEVRRITDKFCDYWLSTGMPKSNWDAAWRNWCRNEERTWTASTRVPATYGFESAKDKARRAVAEAISGKGAANYAYANENTNTNRNGHKGGCELGRRNAIVIDI